MSDVINCPVCGAEMEHKAKGEHPNRVDPGCCHWYCAKCDEWNWPAGSEPNEPCPVCDPDMFPCNIPDDE